MSKIEIKYSFLPGKSLKEIEYSAEDFVLENDSQLLLVGFTSDLQKLVVRGVVIDPSNDTYHLYAIKYENDKVYQNIIKAAMGKTIELRSDISSSFWTATKFTKKEMPDKLKYFLTEDVLIMVHMNPDTKRTSKYGINRGGTSTFMGNTVETYQDEYFTKPE